MSIAQATAALAATLYVDASSKVKPPDGSELAPFRTIKPALDLALPGDVVQVAPGRYEERVHLKAGVELRGGGAASTTIDATDGLLGAVVCADEALIQGFRIVVREDLAFPLAAVECSDGASPEISDNVIEAPGGVAILLEDSRAWIHHNAILGGIRTTEAFPGAILGDGLPVIEHNEITSNGVAIGLAFDAGSARIQQNVLRGRVGVGARAPTEITISNNVFLPSAALPPLPRLGGLFILQEDILAPPVEFGVRVVGNTFRDTEGIHGDSLEGIDAAIANNILVEGTVGIELEDGAAAEIRNNDVFGNRAGIIGASTNYVGIADQTGSNGNLSVDPDFVDTFFEDFRLRPESPALDAGSDDAEDVAGSEDFDGDPRVVDGDGDDEDVVDMGAQEFQPDEELPLPALPIEVDVLPGKSPNELKFGKVAKGNGKVEVAILSDDELDAPAEVDAASLILDREPVLRCRAKDVDRDDRRDLVCSFPLRGISLEGWPISEPPACVRGLTPGGRKLLGCDEVEIVP